MYRKREELRFCAPQSRRIYLLNPWWIKGKSMNLARIEANKLFGFTCQMNGTHAKSNIDLEWCSWFSEPQNWIYQHKEGFHIIYLYTCGYNHELGENNHNNGHLFQMVVYGYFTNYVQYYIGKWYKVMFYILKYTPVPYYESYVQYYWITYSLCSKKISPSLVSCSIQYNEIT